MSWAHHQPLHNFFYLENNSTLRVLKQKWPKQIRFYLAPFSYFQPLGYPVGSPLASSCVWTGVATAPCFGVAFRACVQNWATDSRGLRKKISRKSSFNNEFHPGVSSRDLFGVIRDPFTQVGKLTSTVDKKDHDLNHLDNGVIFPICCTKTNGVAAIFFGKTFLNSSGCQCWNMRSGEM